MITLLFIGFVGVSATMAFADWRRGWLLAVVCGVLQDPARKLTPGAPVAMSMSIVAVYAAILFANLPQIRAGLADFARRFPRVTSTLAFFAFFLLLAALNGLVTFGAAHWIAPMLSLFIYVAPLPAVILGYLFVDREERLLFFLRFYAVLTAIALVGSLLEYMRVQSPALGLVSVQGEYLRHLPGLQIRMISGFYRGPDIMGWHAATLTCVAAALAIRGGTTARAWPWMAAAAWGFFHVMISGRRKALYYVVVFAAVLLVRYFRRLKVGQIAAILALAATLSYVVYNLASQESTSMYAKGATTARNEVLARLEGGFIQTVLKSGLMGAGLGTATQGIYHLVGQDMSFGWQEGGLGKFAIELGVPGVLAAGALALALLRILFRISAYPDEAASSQFLRVVLFALVVANISNFLASAQAYSDSTLTLLTAFLTGCLFGTATLDERVARRNVAAAQLEPVPA